MFQVDGTKPMLDLPEVLNLTSKTFKTGFLCEMPEKAGVRIVELQNECRVKFNQFQRGSGTSFDVPFIKYVKDIISHYGVKAVMIDDHVNALGLAETLQIDSGITVYLDSEKERGIFRYSPGQERVALTTIH